MRQAFVSKLTEMAEKDDSIHLITADTGFTVFDDFQKRFPLRYLNIGISESAMVGYAAGLALTGRTVFLYGIVPFVTLRCCEQIRNDLCMHGLRVRIIGVGQGLTYGPEGATHHAIEDLAVLAALPGMTVVCPGDPVETAALMDASSTWEGPAYFRLGKSGEPVVHRGLPPDMAIGRATTVREGEDAVLFATGNMLHTAMQAAEVLSDRGCSAAVVSMHTIEPFDSEAVASWTGRCGVVATLEEHVREGGLGSRVAGVVAGNGSGVRLLRFAVDDEFVTEAAGQDSLRQRYGLEPDQVASRVLESVQREQGR